MRRGIFVVTNPRVVYIESILIGEQMKGLLPPVFEIIGRFAFNQTPDIYKLKYQ